MSSIRYTLMNKNHPVLDFLYNHDAHCVMKVLELHDLAYAPPAIIDVQGNVTKASINSWRQGACQSGGI